jgi:hypothetical protein
MKKTIVRIGALGGNDRIDLTNAVLKLSKQRKDDNRTKQLILNRLDNAKNTEQMIFEAVKEFPNYLDIHRWSDELQKWVSDSTLARFFPKLN